MGGREDQSLPLGYRFMPSDEELILHFLRPKTLSVHSFIPTVTGDLHDPLRLCEKSLAGGDGWYFFCKKQEYRRAISTTTWKMAGEDIELVTTVSSGKKKSTVIGTKELLSFCSNRGVDDDHRSWTMHSYHLTKDDDDRRHRRSSTSRRFSRKRAPVERQVGGGNYRDHQQWVLCRVSASYRSDGELSSMDEQFVNSLDDLDDISFL